MRGVAAIRSDAPAALRASLEAARFSLDPEAGQQRDAILAQLIDYVQPRLERLDAPLLAVVGGSTGAGKSTLVNGLVGRRVSAAGVIRPTTRQPLIICHPADADWFADSRILPGLARVQADGAGGESAAENAVRILTSDAVPEGLALLDAPDFDSIDDANRALAAQLLAAADLWVFVTTPARYADALPWQFLQGAAARDLAVIVVLNRVDDDARESVGADLHAMMLEAGLADATLIEVAQTAFEDVLPAESVERLHAHLTSVASDAQSRREVAARSLVGASRELAGGVDALADIKADEVERATVVRAFVHQTYREATEHVIEATSDGRLLREEVLGRWQDFVGTSDMFRKVERWFSKSVDRVGRFFTGKPEPLQEVETEIEHGLLAVIVDEGQSAAANAWRGLGRSEPQLRTTAAAAGDLGSPSADLSDRAARLIREWQASLVETIQESAGGKRMRARILSLGLNAITVALMIVVFASTGGLTGGEVAIAGGSAVVGQKLLETVFGEDAVRRLAAKAKAELNERVDALMLEEAERFEALLEPLETGPGADELRERAADLVALAKEAAQ